MPLSSSTESCSTPAPSATGIDSSSIFRTAGVQARTPGRKRKPICRKRRQQHRDLQRRPRRAR